LLLCSFIEEFKIWKTGSVFILDREGTVIAYSNTNTVMTRENFMRRRELEPDYKSAGDFHQYIIESEASDGIGSYYLRGVKRYCAYAEVAGTDGWYVGVTAPVQESPFTNTTRALLVAALIVLGLGLIVDFSFSGILARPFEQTEELKKTAEASSEAKSNFLANMSHELRTPLNAIIGLSELELQTGELPDAIYGNLEKIYNSGMVLLGIVNDILDISKIESGKFGLIPMEYEVPSLINDTVSLNLIRIGSKPIVFHLFVEENLPFRLLGDGLRIKQIFNNLLSNAFKYTERGTVNWHLSSEVDGDTVWIKSLVEDTGVGIRQKDIPTLFTNYSQVDAKSNRSIEGTGLGLSITKDLVELMGGEIGVESEYGKGSAFTVRFRQHRVDAELIGKDIAQNLENFQYIVSKRHKNEQFVRSYIPYASVLVVDDVPINLDVAKGMMKPYGMRVDCVSSGQAAVDLVRNEETRYNAIFMDHMMPGMNGIEAVRIIREEIDSDYARSVPIIALTANAIIGNEALFLGCGFQGFLSKPIDILRMDKLINDFVRDKNREKEPAKAPPENSFFKRPLVFQGRKIPGLNIQQGLARYSGDEGAYLAILRSYMNNTPAMLESVRAVSLETLPAYAITVHGIKGSSYGISAEAVGKQAEALEMAAKMEALEMVISKNGAFINAVETLVQNLAGFFKVLDRETQKPEKSVPDPKVLNVILNASKDYDIERLDSALAELEQYRYESGGELVEWLHEQISKSEFGAIEERLGRNA
jgi:signal transduction histidine kinase/CheY-like chemotaxis protein